MQRVANHDEDRQRILQAAHRCLSDPHAGPVAMATILRTAGVSSRAFYRHFGSKDDLFLALMQREVEAINERVDRIADDADGSPLDQLATWLRAMFDMAANPYERQVLSVIDSDEVRAAKGYRQARERLHRARERGLADILRRGRRDGSFPITEPDTDAAAINAVVSRVLGSRAFHDLGALTHGHAAVLDFALRALGAAPRP